MATYINELFGQAARHWDPSGRTGDPGTKSSRPRAASETRMKAATAAPAASPGAYALKGGNGSLNAARAWARGLSDLDMAEAMAALVDEAHARRVQATRQKTG
jgi:hypothetical protein